MVSTVRFTPAPTSNAVTEGRLHPGPQRHLAPHLAAVIREGKEATGLSWRQFAQVVGKSRAHLNHISLGRRVPSRATAEALIETLDLDGDIADELRAAAAPMWWERLDGGR